MAPIRILQVMPAMDSGGMETFVMNVYRSMDRDKVQFDFLYHYDKPCFYDYEIQALGGSITKLTVRQDNNVPHYMHELDAFFTAHPEYKIIHGHYSGFGMFYNKVAKRHGVPVRIGHSHNTAYERNLVGLLDKGMSSRFSRLLTDRFACSQMAGRMLFPHNSFTVLPNGIDTEAFSAHDPERRIKLRSHLGVADSEILLGHVGRFSAQKNHAGLLRVFKAVLARQPKARLLLLGSGPLEEKTRKLAADLGIADRVIFAGVRTDISSFYDAMDAFLLPSLFEGMPVVLVEAQTFGLPCFVSDTVDPGTAFVPGIHFLPLGNPETWADAILATPLTRDAHARQEAVDAGFDISCSAQYLQDFYLRRYNEVT